MTVRNGDSRLTRVSVQHEAKVTRETNIDIWLVTGAVLNLLSCAGAVQRIVTRGAGSASILSNLITLTILNALHRTNSTTRIIALSTGAACVLVGVVGETVWNPAHVAQAVANVVPIRANRARILIQLVNVAIEHILLETGAIMRKVARNARLTSDSSNCVNLTVRGRN